MIEPYDWASEAEEFGLEAGVVSDEDGCTIQDAIRRFNVHNAKIFHVWTEPEFVHGTVPGMCMTEDGPAFHPKGTDHPDKMRQVVAERRGGFWYAGKLCIPVEREGDSAWITLTPVPDVPRVQSWAPDDSGRLVRVPIVPPTCHFVVGTDVPDNVAMLGATGVEGLDSDV